LTLYYHPVDIGNLHLEGNLLAAPMAGYTDFITRSISLEMGASMAYTEMISAEALIRDSQKTLSMLKRAQGERFLAVQLFGSTPENLGHAAMIAAENGADLLDLNAGCPVSKIIKKGSGAALARDISRLGLVVRAMVKAGLPVSVKIRSGWDNQELNWKNAAHAVIAEGAAAIGFHPRTRSQGYGGKSDWKALKDMVESVSVPVFGSGDLDSPSAVLQMFKETGCQGVMIARGAMGNPDIFCRTRILLTEGVQAAAPTREQILGSARNHLEAAVNAFGEDAAIRNMKKHLAAYVKGWPSSSELRNKLMRTTDLSQILKLLH